MTVRVEKLDAPVLSGLIVAVLSFLSSTARVLWRRRQRSTSMVMSDDWMSDRARTDAKQGWN